MSKTSYQWKKTAMKFVYGLVAFGLPMAVNAFIVEFPGIAQMSVGAALLALVNFLKHKVGVRLP